MEVQVGVCLCVMMTMNLMTPTAMMMMMVSGRMTIRAVGVEEEEGKEAVSEGALGTGLMMPTVNEIDDDEEEVSEEAEEAIVVGLESPRRGL